MNYIDKTKSEGEEILNYFNVSRYMYWNSYIAFFLGILLVIVGIVLSFQEEELLPSLNLIFIAGGFFTVFMGVYVYLTLSSINMGITNKRIVIKTGIVAINTDELRLKAIETVEVSQGILGRLMGFGDVHITGKGNSEVLYKNIDEPLKVKQIVGGIVSKYGDNSI